MKMATGCDTVAADSIITFDIFHDSVLNETNDLSDKLTQEEKEEIYRVVEQMEGVNSREVIDFIDDDTTIAAMPTRHKVITSEELDRLASKNSADSTAYQTKWAVTVMKGTINQYLCIKITKHDFSTVSSCGLNSLNSPRNSTFSVRARLRLLGHETKQVWYQNKPYQNCNFTQY